MKIYFCGMKLDRKSSGSKICGRQRDTRWLAFALRIQLGLGHPSRQEKISINLFVVSRIWLL